MAGEAWGTFKDNYLILKYPRHPSVSWELEDTLGFREGVWVGQTGLRMVTEGWGRFKDGDIFGDLILQYPMHPSISWGIVGAGGYFRISGRGEGRSAKDGDVWGGVRRGSRRGCGEENTEVSARANVCLGVSGKSGF